MSRVSGRRVVLGIGNADRGDDAAGHEVVRKLRGMLAEDVVLVAEAGEVARVLAQIEEADAAFFVDACRSGGVAGSVQRFDIGAGPLPQHAFRMSTHGVGLGEAFELARALNQLPRICIVYAIEGACFEAGAPLTSAVADAVEEVARRLSSELGG